MTATAQEFPGLQERIKGHVAVLREELVIDGKPMTVAQVAQGYRTEKAKAALYAALGIALAAMLAFASYWSAEHPTEMVRVVVPVK